ncbi:toxin VasX [Burkholderia sp. BCC1999]|uniref:toxin VasX n=1 Tax=Burkholderia sp. BCC1999 TaxID=2817448 RepID=UPI002AC35FC1|nr:toxin VasX [Burkholderia sp. BCC1999]
MAGTTSYASARESCQARIPLFPLRYSAHAKPKGGALYSYELPSLDRSFRALDHAQYGLRCIGGGFIYLFDETQGDVFVWRVNEENGQFVELQSKHRSLEGALKDYKPGHTVRHIWARECSVVHILLTDTLLTERKIRAIQSDRDGIRTQLATTIDVKAWHADAPAKHTFAAEGMDDLVEEFKGTNLDFSPWKLKNVAPTAKALLTSMKAVAPAKQIAVVMRDNIALVQDLGGLFQQARQAMESYNSAPDKSSTDGDVKRFRKMLIAELIERIYESAYARKKGLAGKSREAFDRTLQREIDERGWIRKRFADNLAVIEREPARHRPSSYPNARRQLDAMPTEPIGQRSAVLSNAAGLYARHVREADRVKFMQEFAKEIGKRHGVVLDHKNDRCKWLESYQTTKSANDMGTSFLRYDTEDPNSSTSHALAFAICIESMIWGTETTPPGKKDNERELFERWWKLPWQINPILVNIDHDKGLIDAIWDNKKDVATDVAMSKGLGQLLRYVALHYLMEQASVYMLSRFPNRGSAGGPWHGAARDAVAHRLHQLAGMGTVEDANRLVNMVETRYQDRLTIRRLTSPEAVAALDAAAGFPPGTVARGSIAVGAGDTIELVVFQRLTPITRLANPFLQVFERGVSGGVAFFSLLNLKAAVIAFDTDKSDAARWNLRAAIMGVGSATNGILMNTRALMPTVYSRASIAGFLARRLAGAGALRLFGYAGAIFDALSNWYKAADQKRIGNHEAAKAYALAGVGMGLGGAALTTGGGAFVAGGTMASIVAGVPVWGWLVASVILLGMGVWWLWSGDKAQFTPLGFWLNDGTFGKRELLGRTSVVTYATLDDENKAYVQIVYAPQLEDSEWKIATPKVSPMYVPGSSGVYLDYDPRVVLKIVYPLEGTVKPPIITHTSNGAGGAAPTVIDDGKGKQLEGGGAVRTYVVTGLSKKTADCLTLIAAYTPTLLQDTLQTQCDIAAGDAPFYYRR